MYYPGYTQEELNQQLFYSCELSDFKRIKRLIALGADVNSMVTYDNDCLWLGLDMKEGWESAAFPIHQATMNKDIEVFLTLLNYGANPLFQSDWEEEPLYWAVRANNFEVIKILVGKYKNNPVHSNLDGRTPLIAAREKANKTKNYKIYKYLLRKAKYFEED